jgi:hypothetical protein
VSEALRLTDILTTAAAVANFKGVPDVSAEHLLLAIEVLQGEKTLDDLGRPVSPLVTRMTGPGSGATPGVKALAQRWFARQGSDPTYELSEDELETLRGELATLVNEEAAAN